MNGFRRMSSRAAAASALSNVVVSVAAIVRNEMLEERLDHSFRREAAAFRAAEFRPLRELHAEMIAERKFKVRRRRSSRQHRERHAGRSREELRELFERQRRRLAHVAADRTDAAQMKLAHEALLANVAQHIRGLVLVDAA